MRLGGGLRVWGVDPRSPLLGDAGREVGKGERRKPMNEVYVTW